MKRYLTFTLGAGFVAALALGTSILGLPKAQAQGQITARSAPAIASRTTANLPSGEALFERKCSHCHELDEHDRGPAIRNVIGRLAGHEAGFRYSKALRTTWFTWDEASLDIWLQGPSRMVPGTDMRQTVKKPQERAAIIAYLKQINTTNRSEPNR